MKFINLVLNNYLVVKNIRIQSILLIFILITPLVFNAVIALDDNSYFYAFCEETQNEERESEEKEGREEVDESEEFIFNKHTLSSLLKQNTFRFPTKNNTFKNLNREVLTPPPDFI